MYGHVYQLAQAAAKGAQVLLKRIPKTLSKEILGNMGAPDFAALQAALSDRKSDGLTGRRGARQIALCQTAEKGPLL